MPTWLHIPGCPALGEWSHRHGYLDHENIFCIVLLCVIVTSSSYLLLCEIHITSVVYWAHLCMKYSHGISHFIEEISSLSHSIFFLCFFALITAEGFLISPCYSMELCIPKEFQKRNSFLLCLSLLFFSPLFVKTLQTAILPFCISFSWGWSRVMNETCVMNETWTCHEPPSIVHQALCLSDLVP